jgi:hypothetical protein
MLALFTQSKLHVLWIQDVHGLGSVELKRCSVRKIDDLIFRDYKKNRPLWGGFFMKSNLR